MLITKYWFNIIRQPKRFLVIELVLLGSILLHLGLNPLGIERIQLALAKFWHGNPATFYQADHPLQVSRVSGGEDVSSLTFLNAFQGQQESLADFSGKIVILELWATWCGPCQEPMRKLQTLKQEHPEWGDEVVVITLSIDQSLKKLRTHLVAKGWTQTHNVWAGKGDAADLVKKTLGTKMIPYVFVLDKEGRIEARGMLPQVNLGSTVKRLLHYYR